jgi:hypothetical protein
MVRIERVDSEIELEFIREFSSGGNLRGAAMERSERIRVAIYSHQLQHQPFRDAGMSYAEAFEMCYGRPLEMRLTPRAPRTEKIDALENEPRELVFVPGEEAGREADEPEQGEI